MDKQADPIRVWFRLIRLETRIRAEISSRLKRLGLSVPQCDVLTTLTEQEGISQQDLAQRLYVTKGNISGLVDRLVAAGLVQRRSIAGDRRSHAIFLTEDGRRVALEGIKTQRDFVAETFGRMPQQQLMEFESMLVAARDLVRAKTGQDEEVSSLETSRSPAPVGNTHS